MQDRQHRFAGARADRVGAHAAGLQARFAVLPRQREQAKAAAIGKAAAKISDLEDDRAELVAHGAEAQAVLREKYKAALEALDKELKAKGDKLDSDLAAAAAALVAADKAYEATVKAARDKLGVEGDA